MSGRKEFRELASPEAVRETLEGLPIEAGTETVPLSAARGRVLAERIDADIDVPGFDRATMDGYAVQAADTFGADERDPAILELAGVVHAGEEPAVAVAAGSAVEISTGAVLPSGADAVVMVERTHERGDRVAVESPVAPGDHVMAAGTDIGAGQRAAGPGRLLTAREMALLAALGVANVPVYRRPRVGIVSTGDELVRPGEALDHGAGQIYDVNSHALATAVEAAGGEAILYPHVADDYAPMRRMLERAAEECELVLSSGSTSASAVDVIYEVVEERGEVSHHGVAIKPGKPMLIGRMGPQSSAYVGLPGYPVSALMVFRRFIAPRLREAAGLPPAEDARVSATMVADERFGEGRVRLLPVGLVRAGDGSLLAYPVDKGSGATTSLVDADGVVEVPAGTDYVGTDEVVTVHLFAPDVRPPTILGVGEDDPAFGRVLDALDDPRFLPLGSREGARRYERGIPDVAVVATETAAPLDGTVIGTWVRTWGLIVPSGNPHGIQDVADLVDGDLHLANLAGTALRTAFDERLDALAAEREGSRSELAGDIPGYGVGRPAHESAARLVMRGDADVGLGLAATADRLELGFVSLGEQQLTVVAARGRREKPGVVQLETALADGLAEASAELAGYRSLADAT